MLGYQSRKSHVKRSFKPRAPLHFKNFLTWRGFHSPLYSGLSIIGGSHPSHHPNLQALGRKSIHELITESNIYLILSFNAYMHKTNKLSIYLKI